MIPIVSSKKEADTEHDYAHCWPNSSAVKAGGPFTNGLVKCWSPVALLLQLSCSVSATRSRPSRAGSSGVVALVPEGTVCVPGCSFSPFSVGLVFSNEGRRFSGIVAAASAREECTLTVSAMFECDSSGGVRRSEFEACRAPLSSCARCLCRMLERLEKFRC